MEWAREQVPHYSTCNTAALEVWEHMVEWSHAHNWSPVMHANKASVDDSIFPHRDAHYEVSFMFGCTAKRPTMAAAICQAALKAIGWQPKNSVK